MSGTAHDEHPSPEELDVLLDRRAAEEPVSDDLSRHVATCPRCRDAVAGLSDVRALLRAEAAHVPPPPAELGDRIAAALAHAADEDEHERSSRTAAATVVPIRQRSRPPRWAAVAAGLLVLGGAGLTAGQLLGDGSPVAGTAAEDASAAPESAAAGAAGGAGGAEVLATGTDYAEESLAEQARALLATSRDGEARAGAAEEAAPAPDAAGESALRLANPADLAACLEALGADAAAEPVVDLATWQGREVAVIVLDEGSRHTVWVVDRGCRPGADGLVHYQALPD